MQESEREEGRERRERGKEGGREEGKGEGGKREGEKKKKQTRAPLENCRQCRAARRSGSPAPAAPGALRTPGGEPKGRRGRAKGEVRGCGCAAPGAAVPAPQRCGMRDDAGAAAGARRGAVSQGTNPAGFCKERKKCPQQALTAPGRLLLPCWGCGAGTAGPSPVQRTPARGHRAEGGGSSAGSARGLGGTRSSPRTGTLRHPALGSELRFLFPFLSHCHRRNYLNLHLGKLRFSQGGRAGASLSRGVQSPAPPPRSHVRSPRSHCWQIWALIKKRKKEKKKKKKKKRKMRGFVPARRAGRARPRSPCTCLPGSPPVPVPCRSFTGLCMI